MMVVERAELKKMAKEQLRGNFGKAIAILVLYTIIVSLVGYIPYAGFVITLLISGVLCVGLIGFFLQLAKGEQALVSSLFSYFKDFGQYLRILGAVLLVGLYVFLWSLLLIVPGIIAALRYSQVFYILAEDPNVPIREAISLSARMMAGKKTDLFLLQLSFLGWMLLCILTLGIGLLWLSPYMYTTFANFYLTVKKYVIPAKVEPEAETPAALLAEDEPAQEPSAPEEPSITEEALHGESAPEEEKPQEEEKIAPPFLAQEE